MATVNTLAIKYTDENYVTKQAFFAALGSSLVERLWDNVLSYRASFAAKTNLRTVSQLPFCLTETDVLKAKVQLFVDKLYEWKAAYDKFASLPEEKKKIDRSFLMSALREASDIEGIKISEATLSAMLSGFYQGGVPEQVPILGYRDFLRLDAGRDFSTCETFFASVYSAMSGTEELVTFYRVNDATVGQGRAGEYAKYNDIESLQDNLEEFVKYDPLNAHAKAFLAMYFVEYVQPFASHNGLLAVALCKKMLDRAGLGTSAYALPLEGLLLRGNKAKELYLETAKTGDFTYVMLHLIEELYPKLEAMLNELSRTHTEALKREYRSQVHEEEVAPSPKLEEVAMSAPKTVPVEVEAAPAPSYPEVPLPPKQEMIPEEPEEGEEVEILVEEDVEEKPTPAKTEPIRHVNAYESVPEVQDISLDSRSVFSPKVSLSDKEVKMAARYIMETHPDISKPQALFYASHCTLGRYYTIQDFKKTMRVAYETARTSMDRLAQAKLYKKLRIKNKYVYTPRKSGEKE
ncbi:MAG: hypothetical protein SPL80_07250 [Bacilli bacterium]|nr:hypothetical protein [Bacilli bacterium]